MRNGSTQGNLRQQLIQAGIRELGQQGVQRFSVRRIANECGVSCAAPYRHFENKSSFISAIFDYINDEWHAIGRRVAQEDANKSTRRTLVDVSMAYIHFLLDNPHFRSIIMLRTDGLDPKYLSRRGEVSRLSNELISRYCAEVGMSDEDRTRKTFAVRSLIYGASLMLDNGELEPTPENFDMIARSIDREFDLP